MEAKFTRGPYQRKGRHVETAAWSANVHPFCKAVDTAELEAVATLFQASPLLYEALEQQLAQWQLISNMVDDNAAVAATVEVSMQLINNALNVARGEK